MANIVIADSGSTKTDWRIVDSENFLNKQKILTAGINPYFMSDADITAIVRAQWSAKVEPGSIDKIWFYGAGCSADSKKQKVRKGLHNFFAGAEVFVYHDLLAAARALFGDQNGIAGILGTGSNSCKFSDGEVSENVFSLGYFFGDEGSGAHIGKSLVKAFLKSELPAVLQKSFYDRYGYSREQIIDQVYNKPNPNRFLAGFAAFCGENNDSPFIQQIVRDCFRDYFRYQISRYSSYRSYPLRLTGSVAYYFKDSLEVVAEEFKTKVELVIKNPADRLVEYHLQRL